MCMYILCTFDMLYRYFYQIRNNITMYLPIIQLSNAFLFNFIGEFYLRY